MSGRRRMAALLVVALAIVACNGDDGGSSTTGDVGTTQPDDTTTAASAGGEGEVTIQNFSFDAPTTVQVGETVVVTNLDASPHTWTAEGGVFDSGTLGQGDTFEFTFEKAGEISYFCAIHPTQMTGTITVEG